MNRTYQIVDVKSSSENILKISDRCRSDFKKVTGVFFTTASDEEDIKPITCRLSINGKEVMPKGTNVALFLATPYASRKEVMLDLEDETIECENSPIELELEYNSSIHAGVKLYLLVSND